MAPYGASALVFSVQVQGDVVRGLHPCETNPKFVGLDESLQIWQREFLPSSEGI